MSSMEWSDKRNQSILRWVGGPSISGRQAGLNTESFSRETTGSPLVQRPPSRDKSQGIWPYNGASDSFEIKLAIQDTAKSNKQG